MAGEDALADAVLGGASDFMSDILAQLIKIYHAKDDEKVIILVYLTFALWVVYTSICNTVWYGLFTYVSSCADTFHCLMLPFSSREETHLGLGMKSLNRQ